ncbi:verrucotoxin subunit beta-like [Diadema setosum]|uniref:verrucotoxin subunit beta-like n=1 Tax=Diadema setosum TaxID=31175 RepID=UPI003B3AA445
MQLGMLYDCRDDTFIPGFTLWDPEVLTNDRDVRRQQGTYFNVITSDNINNKSSALNIEASLKASFMGGLVEVSGSAKYINDKKTTSRQSRLTLQYKTTTKFEQLTMKHLGRHNVQYPDVFGQGIGTHVVTGILYGAQAFFVFDRYLKNDESDKHVHGHVNAIIEKIMSLSTTGEGDLKLTESEKEEADKLQCKFYGDFALKSNPASYEEAVVIYKQLPSMLGDNGEFAVPLTVWLYPLSKLDSKAAKLFGEISVNIIGQVQNILEGFDQWKMRCDDLVKNDVCTDFPNFTEKLDLFRKLLLEFKQGFQQKIAQALPKIRGGEAVEQVLIDIISDYEKSPFHSGLVEHWLKRREKEMNIVKTFLKGLNSFRIIGSREDLDELLLDFSIEHVVAFSFSSLGLEDDYLKVLSRFIRTQTEESYSPKKEWFDNVATSKRMRMEAKQFKDFANANSTSEETTFVIMGFDDGEESTPEGGSLFHYEHSVLTTKNFEPPGVPGKPEILETYHDSAILRWTAPQTWHACIQSYLVKYRETSSRQDPEWREFRTDNTATLATVPELKPNITYEFSVAAIYNIWHSLGGAVSKVATTLPSSPPHNVRRNQVSRTSITVVWDKPDVLGEGVRVMRYRVKYIPTVDKDPDHVFLTETKGNVCLCTIDDLDSGTTYKISVSALCGTAKDSAFSEPVEITSGAAVSRSPTQEVLKELQLLEAAVEGLQPQIQMGLCKLDELQVEQRILEQHEADIEANKDFVYEVEVQKSRKIDITGEYITNCSRCHVTCHYPCGIADDKKKAGCAAMKKDGTCTVCPGRCVWNVHFNQAYKFEYYTEKETRTYAELENRYNDAAGKKLTVEQVVKNHQEEFESIQKCVYQLITESQRSLKRLEEIALRPNPLSTLDSVDLLIETEKREAKPGWKSRVKALQDVRNQAEILSQII